MILLAAQFGIYTSTYPLFPEVKNPWICHTSNHRK